jgi:broad specificity polyphosphatase/5'/3'-nucleotidase SurE
MLPAVAFSLDSHAARSLEDYQASADLAVAVIKAMLDVLCGGSSQEAHLLCCGNLLNVNFPAAASLAQVTCAAQGVRARPRRRQLGFGC